MTTASPPQPPTSAAPTERRATLRIDAQPGGKRFQGVWLELPDGKRWVLDYRARELWRAFADHEVVVTGHCYQPQGQAILATHFEVERLRRAVPVRGAGPYLEIGPTRVLRGTLVATPAPPGSKLAGTSRTVFHADDGEAYQLVGDQVPPAGAIVQIRGRVLAPDMSFVARGDGPDLWVLDVRDPDAVRDPEHEPARTDCPE
ncbi:MAG: hypothetical protein H0T89_14840 [Deltaproteobacteria bacterium]|nr:hypothetical protein [Deltaproteobacteria bacterium]MDQ3295466.1 hypothetical protein [Myxococcota bacterium]